MPAHPISLDKKIVLILFASISFTLLLFGFVFSVLLTDLYQDSSKNDLLDSIQIFQHDLQTKRTQLSKQANLLKNNEEFISSVNLIWKYQDINNYDNLIFDPEKESLAQRLKQIGQSASISLVGFYSPQGEPIAFYYNDEPAEKTGYASFTQGKKIYQFIDGSNAPLLSPLISDVLVLDNSQHKLNFVRNNRTQQLSIELIAKLQSKRAGKTQLIGWLRLAILIDQRYIDSMAKKSHSAIAIKTQNALIASANYQPDLYTTAADSMPIPAFRLDKNTQNNPFWLPFEHYFQALFHLPMLPNSQTQLYFGIDKGDLHANIDTFKKAVFLVLFLSGLLVIPLGWLYFRKEITQPIKKLTLVAENISAGEFSPLEDVQRNDEMGILFKAFKHMYHEIGEREESLQSYHQQLEQTVAKRTADLENSIAELNYQKFAMDQHAIVSIANRHGIITYVNKKFCKVSGYTQDELVGQDHNLLNSGEHGKSFFEKMWKDICSGKVWHGDIKNKTKSGTFYWVNSTIVPYLDKFGTPYQFVSIRTDISYQKETEDELQLAKYQADKANRAKSEFLSNMSHELRTPLNSILGFAQLLEYSKKNPLDERQLEQLKYILIGGEHLLGLIDDVLELAKIEAGKLTLSIERVEFSLLLNESIKIAQVLTSKQEIKIIDRSQNLPFIFVDYMRAKQVILNLLSNAIKYNKPQGQVWIDNEIINNQYLRLSISDSGIGIAQKFQTQLFKPFSRLGAEQSNIEGTGIGLSLSKQLMEEMQGKVGFESIAAGGSKFWLDFPLDSSIVKQANLSHIENEPLDTKTVQLGESIIIDSPKTLLYIEDNPANSRLMEDIVADIENLDLLVAANAELGLNLAKKNNPDIIITDINLPGMDGFQLLSEFKKFT